MNQHTSLSLGNYLLAIVCLALSGFAAALYGVTWVQQFAIAFGTGGTAATIVLGAFLMGLVRGATQAGRMTKWITKPVLVFAVFSVGSALAGVAMPWLIKLVVWLQESWLGTPTLPETTGISLAVQFLIASLALLLPTICIGVGLPLLVHQTVREEEHLGSRAGLLFGTSILGAAIGVFSAAYVFLPKFTLNETVWFGAAIFVLVGLLALMMSRQTLRITPTASASLKTTWSWVLPLVACSFLVAWICYLCWTRLFIHVVGGDILAQATMAAGFLGGMGLGALLGSGFAQSRSQSASVFVIVQVGMAVTVAAVFLSLETITVATPGLDANGLRFVLLILACSLFAGAGFPMAVRLSAPATTHVSVSTGYVIFWCALGAIAGAIVTPFFLLSRFDFASTVRIAVISSVLLALASALLLAQRTLLRTALTAAVGAIVIFVFQPSRPTNLLQSSAVGISGDDTEYFSGVGSAGSVLLTSQRNDLQLRIDGLPTMGITRVGAPPIPRSQHWLGFLPAIARGETRDMLFVGLDNGVALEAIPASVTNVDVAEWESEVFHTHQETGKYRQFDPFATDRTNIIISDPVAALARTTKQYQSIVVQTRYPWTRRDAYYFTTDFMELAKERLTEGGVFLQWIDANTIDEAQFRTLTATVANVFSDIRLYRPTPDTLIFLGSEQPLNLETYISRDPSAFNSLFYRRFGLNSLEDFLIALAADNNGLRTLAADVQVNRADRNEFAKPRPTSLAATLDRVLAPVDLLTDSDSWIYRFNPDMLYLSQQLHMRGYGERAQILAETLPVGPERWLVAASNLSSQGKGDQALRALATARSQRPEDPQVIYALLIPHLGQIASGNVSEEVQSLTDSLSGACVNVLEAIRHVGNDDWASVVRMDNRLSRVRPTQICYPMAVQLRADWRSQARSEQQPALAKEAIQLVDAVLATHQTLELYAARAAAALETGEPAIFIESALILANAYNFRVQVANQQADDGLRDGVRQRLELVAQELEKLEFDSGYSERLRLARRVYRGLIGSLEEP